MYKLIFNVVVPVSKGIKTVRQNMEQARDAVASREANANTKPNSNFSNSPNPASPPTNAEYIDFEEVKKK